MDNADLHGRCVAAIRGNDAAAMRQCAAAIDALDGDDEFHNEPVTDLCYYIVDCHLIGRVDEEVLSIFFEALQGFDRRRLLQDLLHKACVINAVAPAQWALAQGTDEMLLGDDLHDQTAYLDDAARHNSRDVLAQLVHHFGMATLVNAARRAGRCCYAGHDPNDDACHRCARNTAFTPVHIALECGHADLARELLAAITPVHADENAHRAQLVARLGVDDRHQGYMVV